MDHSFTPFEQTILSGLGAEPECSFEVWHPLCLSQELDSFEEKNADNLENLHKGLSKFHVNRLVLEGGHIYSDEIPDVSHDFQLQTTALLRAHLIRKRMAIYSVLFVDDFHPSTFSLDVRDYCKRALELGWPIDEVILETKMAPVALQILRTLRSMEKILPNDQGFSLKKGNKSGPHLTHSGWEQPSCALLDAALTLVKGTRLRADAVLNVLPEKWRSQQKNTREILKTLLPGNHLPIFNFFTP